MSSKSLSKRVQIGDEAEESESDELATPERALKGRYAESIKAIFHSILDMVDGSELPFFKKDVKSKKSALTDFVWWLFDVHGKDADSGIEDDIGDEDSDASFEDDSDCSDDDGGIDSDDENSASGQGDDEDYDEEELAEETEEEEEEEEEEEAQPPAKKARKSKK